MAFVKMVMGHKNLIKIGFSTENDPEQEFAKEVDFYVKKIRKNHKQVESIESRQ